ncbi:hypothetical protein EDC01DRAFT_676736 [Geopyxis carbonaria]|nr:hypothetical protein EDC01DRAFT_676736 [Geopyxis carbonaria]
MGQSSCVPRLMFTALILCFQGGQFRCLLSFPSLHSNIGILLSITSFPAVKGPDKQPRINTAICSATRREQRVIAPAAIGVQNRRAGVQTDSCPGASIDARESRIWGTRIPGATVERSVGKQNSVDWRLRRG